MFLFVPGSDDVGVNCVQASYKRTVSNNTMQWLAVCGSSGAVVFPSIFFL